MSKKKANKTKSKPSAVNEPMAAYGDKQLVFFNSFEEMAKSDAKEMAKFSSIEHLQHITEYIMHAYSEELKNKMTDLTIYFK